MGVLINRKLLIKKSMIICAGLCSIAGITLNSVSMGTNFWIIASGKDATGSETNFTSNKMAVNYGLFKGQKSLDKGVSPTYYQLTVFCPAGEGLCLLSCGRNAEEQRKEYDYLRFGATPFICTPSTKSLSRSNGTVPASEDQFMDSGYWLTTVIFLSLTLAFQLVSAGLCALNSVDSVPVEVWLGPMGVYVANGAAGLTALIVLSVWGDLFSRHLSTELAVQETILDTWKTDSTQLGYSYWLVLGSLCLTITSCVFIRFRNVPKKHIDTEGTITQENATPKGGNNLLY